jgi:hypothetical protein
MLPILTQLSSILSFTSPLSWSTLMFWTWASLLLCLEPLLLFDLVRCKLQVSVNHQQSPRQQYSLISRLIGRYNGRVASVDVANLDPAVIDIELHITTVLVDLDVLDLGELVALPRASLAVRPGEVQAAG